MTTVQFNKKHCLFLDCQISAELKWRKVSMSTCSRDKLALFCEQMFPAAEKIRSAGVDEAGMHRKDLASFDMLGKRPSFSFHHPRGSSCLGICDSEKYICTSFLTTWIFWSSCDSSSSLRLSVSEWRRFSSTDSPSLLGTMTPWCCHSSVGFQDSFPALIARTSTVLWTSILCSAGINLSFQNLGSRAAHRRTVLSFSLKKVLILPHLSVYSLEALVKKAFPGAVSKLRDCCTDLCSPFASWGKHDSVA